MQGLPQITENVSTAEGGTEKGDQLLSDLMRMNSSSHGQRRNIASGGKQNVAPSTPPFSREVRTAAGGARLRTAVRRPEGGSLSEEKPYS